MTSPSCVWDIINNMDYDASNNLICKTSTSDIFDAFARTVMSATEYEGVLLSYEINDLSSTKILALDSYKSSPTQSDFNFYVLQENDVLKVYSGGAMVADLGSIKVGERVRLSRIQSKNGKWKLRVRYKKRVLYTEKIDSGDDLYGVELYGYSALKTPGSCMLNIEANFIKPLEVDTDVQGVIDEENALNATVNVLVSGGSSPYTYNWPHSGEATSTTNFSSPGQYVVEVTDACNVTLVDTFFVYSKLSWEDEVNISIEGNTITSTAPDAVAYSSNILYAGEVGEITFTADDSGGDKILGIKPEDEEGHITGFMLNDSSGVLSYTAIIDDAPQETAGYKDGDQFIINVSENQEVELIVDFINTNKKDKIVSGTLPSADTYEVVAEITTANVSIQDIKVTFVPPVLETTIVWSDVVGMLSYDSTLAKPSISEYAWNTDAISKTVLTKAKDGYITYIAPINNQRSRFGFGSEIDSTGRSSQIDYGFYLFGSGCYYIENGTTTYLSTYAVNDTLKVDRNGTTVTFLINNSVVHTIEISQPQSSWFVVGQLYNALAELTEIKGGFIDLRLREDTVAINSVNELGQGTIDVSYTGGALPYSYSWSNGAATEDLIDVAQGFYTLSVTDANGDAIVKQYSVFEEHDAQWMEIVNLDTIGGTINKPFLAADGHNAEATSTKVLPIGQDGVISHVVSNMTQFGIGSFVGFSEGENLSRSYTEMKYGFNINIYGTLYKVVDGVRSYVDVLFDDDVLELKRVGNKVVYFRNGKQVYEVAIETPTKPWYVSSSMYYDFTTMSNSQISFESDRLRESLSPNILIDGAGLGSIDVTYVGNNQPLNYQWSNGATTQDIINVEQGYYTLKVFDSAGDSVVTEYGVYDDEITHWSELKSLDTAGTKLYKPFKYLPAWDAGARASKQLTSVEDGYVKHIIEPYNYLVANGNLDIYGFGFTESQELSTSYTDLAYGFFISNYSRVYYVVNGVTTKIDMMSEGDTLELRRIGNEVVYLRNRHVINKVTIATPTKSWFFDAVDYYSSDTLGEFTVSFLTDRLHEDTIVATSFDAQGLGTIDVSYTGGEEPYHYLWSNGDTLEDLNQVPQGFYSLTIWDNLNDTIVKEYTLFETEDVVWTDLVNVDTTGNSLTKISGGGWNAGAISEQRLQPGEDGYISYVITQEMPLEMIGFSHGVNASTSPSELKYGVYISSYSRLYFVLNGNTEKELLNKYRVGDRIEIFRRGNQVEIYQNDKLMRTEFITAPTEDWYAEGLLLLTYPMENLQVRFGLPVTVSPTVAHAVDGQLGTIDLNITGGSPPYQIFWDQDNYLSEAQFDADKQAKIDILNQIGADATAFESSTYQDYKANFSATSLNDVAPGKYRVYIYDNNGTKTEIEIIVNINFVIDENVGLDINGTEISKTAGADSWNEYFTSYSMMGQQDRGWDQIKVNNLTSTFITGIKDMEVTPTAVAYDDIAFGFKVENTILSTVEFGEITPIGTVNVNDLLSIEKIGDKILYYKNDVLLKEVDGVDGVYQLKGHIYAIGISPFDVLFDNRKFRPVISIKDKNVEHLACGESATGSINSKVYSKRAPASFYWEGPTGINSTTYPANQSDISDLEPGEYTLTAQNTYGTTIKKVWIGYETVWEDKQNIVSQPSPNENSIFTTASNVLGTTNSNNVLKLGKEGWQQFELKNIGDIDDDVLVEVTFTNGDGDFGKLYGFIEPVGQISDIAYAELEGASNWYHNVSYSFNLPAFRIQRNLDNSITYTGLRDIYSPTYFSEPGNLMIDGDVEVQVKIRSFKLSAGTENIIELNNHITSFDCHSNQYVKLLKKLDGSYYKTINERLYVDYIEEYNSEDIIFNVYDETNTEVVSELDQPKLAPYGDNRLVFNFSNTGEYLQDGYYVLEMINAKNEKLYLRFKKG